MFLCGNSIFYVIQMKLKRIEFNIKTCLKSCITFWILTVIDGTVTITDSSGVRYYLSGCSSTPEDFKRTELLLHIQTITQFIKSQCVRINVRVWPLTTGTLSVGLFLNCLTMRCVTIQNTLPSQCYCWADTVCNNIWPSCMFLHI